MYCLHVSLNVRFK